MNKLKLALLICLALFFVSCDDDEDKENDIELTINATNLTGNWQFDRVESSNTSATYLDFVEDFSPKNMQLRADMTCTIDGENGSWSANPSQETFSYTITEINDSSTLSLEAEYEVDELYSNKLEIGNDDDPFDTEIIYTK